VSESIRTEQDRRISELQALVSGLSAEVTRMGNNLDECEGLLGTLTVEIRRMENRQKRLYADVRRWQHLVNDDDHND
jgi:adenylosuccinate lyase